MELQHELDEDVKFTKESVNNLQVRHNPCSNFYIKELILTTRAQLRGRSSSL
jgi:hypothetical protein